MIRSLHHASAMADQNLAATLADRVLCVPTSGGTQIFTQSADRGHQRRGGALRRALVDQQAVLLLSRQHGHQ